MATQPLPNRILAIGDIHGHLTALDRLLEIVKPEPADLLVFLGDYVGKGPNVKGVIDRLIEINAAHRCIFLRGNHDQLMIDAYRDQSKFSVWECLAGERPLLSYSDEALPKALGNIPSDHWHFLASICRDYYETPNYIFVNGGIRPHIEPAQEDKDHLLWLTLSLAAPHLSGRTVICGHSSQASGLIADLGHTVCIDSGITRGQWLTCPALDSFEYWQAKEDGIARRGKLAGR